MTYLVLLGGVGACLPFLLVFLLSCTTVDLVERRPCGATCSPPPSFTGLGQLGGGSSRGVVATATLLLALAPPNVVRTGVVLSLGIGGGSGSEEGACCLAAELVDPVRGFLLGSWGVAEP